ncbi:MAG TPA: CBS domain-containing protein [Actinopolymorphaceae bacterium]
MSTDVVSVRRTTPFKQIADVLAENHVSAVPVVDESGAVVGVISETDLLRKEEFQLDDRPRWKVRGSRLVALDKARASTAAGLMTAPPVTISPEATLPEAAHTMAEHAVTHLVVVEHDQLIGIVSRSDLLSVFVRPDHEIHQAVQDALVEYATWEDPFALRVDVEDGVVTLSGELERQTQVDIALHVARVVDGVVDVVDRVGFEIADAPRRTRMPQQRSRPSRRAQGAERTRGTEQPQA